MTPELWALLAVMVLVLWSHHLWHVRRYPDRACRVCNGSGKATSSDWLGRTVIGACRRCRGVEPTTPRRRWTR